MTPDTQLPDYTILLDAETHAFIRRTEAAFPDNAVTLDIEQQRALYNAMCRQFHDGYPTGVVSGDTVVTGADALEIPIRQYTPTTVANTGTIVYLHGGGFVVGDLDSHDDVCAEICERTGMPVTSVDYRLSPENKHPAALNDTLLVVEYVNRQSANPIIVCGDSAGANLAAAACHVYRDRLQAENPTPDIIGQVLIYPGLGGDITKGSYIRHAHSPMLSTQDVRFYSTVRCQNEADCIDPQFAPLHDDNFANLPPTVAFSAQCDPLCDDAEYYCNYIQSAGGKAHWVNEQGLVHGYLRARHSVDRAAKSFDRIIDALINLSEKRWPYP